MEKINFQDLPNTDIPIKASTLNTMQSNIEESCVAVSPTQPETGEKVWIQKGKNLLKKLYKGSYYNLENNTIMEDAKFSRTDFIKIDANKQYIFSNSENMIYGWIDVFDENLNYLERINHDNLLEPFTISNNNAKYILFSLYTRDFPNLSWVQLEQGSTATEYEAYVEPKIWCKNDNGVFEEFYYKEKSVINAWRSDYTTTTTNYEKVNFSGIINIKGNAFKIENNYIVCNKSMLISIEGSYYWTGISDKRVGYRIIIYREDNSEKDSDTFNEYCNRGGYYEVPIERTTFEVSAGDKISLFVRTEEGAGGTSGSRGRFIVQEL